MIDTERTRLELLHPSHAARLSAYYQQNMAHLKPWEPRRPDRFFTRANCAARARQAQKAYKQGRSANFVALDPDTGEIVGICNFSNIVKGVMMAATLGYSISEAHQGQGLMHEILSGAIAYMFASHDLHRIMANYRPENARSAALLSRLGFEKEGLARSYLKIDGAWRDHVLTSKLNPAHTSFQTTPTAPISGT
jgi:ribosomal-protein-alanine N-acetyltransferase